MKSACACVGRQPARAVIPIIRSIADEVEIGGGPGGQGSRLRFVKLL